ncbi:RdgB/HAM1 family non-canonical purine NTP pyrophosphatase [Egicoccus halophilus]|uniref:dITP/XTP pyrophosphatase n=1 Tax=Egicoccus halophilus TaxID=1670830 RepID=A0A8J3ABZ0_9ACTN|nr:RdgB/HAM1 family non-canonical purine NTP pyrophosphatase [Egicoccus halophilus]GGI08030.1 non-canonical purine NTP pyrophosphatase [Egicoccus halophilus]
MTRRLVVATGNAKKLAELQALLAHLDVAVVPMTDLGVPSPPEDGDTFEANALLKARACAAATGAPAIADDSGLEVDALGGAPGVHSARYAGVHGDDAANNAKLVAALADVPPRERTARFVAAVALVTPDGTEHVVRGTMEGRVVEEARGANGFGYDPHFVSDPAGDGRTNAELSPEEKNTISHRGAALRAILPRVEALFGG